MRLIDIDKVINDPTVFAIGKEEIEKYTVKAIPIEWIERWVETCIPHYDYDRMTYIADVYEMLEDWKEENE